MGLISEEDRRPRDWAYRVAFDRKDLPSLQEMARHIRDTHDTDMIEDFNLKCEQKLKGSDESAVFDNGLEIKAVTKTEDLVVNAGLQHCINIIMGTSSARFTHMGVRNASGSQAAITDTTLSGGIDDRNPLLPNGWIESIGMKLFFGCIIPEDINKGGNPIGEMGVFNASSGGILLNHECFPNNQITRSSASVASFFVYDQVAIISCVIEFCPVA